MKNLILTLIFLVCLYSCNKDDSVESKIASNLVLTEVFNFSTDTIDIDLASHSTENSIYVTHSNTLVDSETALKYNLTNSSFSSFNHYDNSINRQIVIMGNDIYSLSSNQESIKYDLSLNNNVQLNTNFNIYNHRVVDYNNDILIVSGTETNVNGNMLIKKYDPNTELYDNFVEFPYGFRSNSDGVVHNDKLYIVGGSNQAIIYDDIAIYDIINTTWEQYQLPYLVYESFVDTYNDYIVIGGNKNSDSSGAFVGVFDTVSGVYSEISTSINLSNISIRGITVLNNEVYIAYTDWMSNFPSIINITVSKATLM